METNQPPDSLKEINLLDLFIMLLKRTKLILLLTVLIPIFTLILTFMITPTYQGLAKILIPGNTSPASAALSQLAGGAAAIVGLAGMEASPSDLYAALLKSRTILDKVMDRFGLLEIYKKRRILGAFRRFTPDDARDYFIDLITITNDSTTGLIDIGVEDPEPEKAALIANAIVEELTKLLTSLTFTDAGKQRIFFEAQLKANHEALKNAEEDVQRFQESTGALQIDEQTRALMEGIASITAQIAAKEIQLKVMKTYATELHPDVKRLERETEGLKEELKKFEAKGDRYYSSVGIPTSDVPSLGTEYLRKIREYKFQETIYGLLLNQYENARIQEAKEAAVVQLVDKAIPPEKVYRPKRILITIIAAGAGFFIAIFVAMVLGAIERSSETEANREKIEIIRGHFKSFPNLTRKLACWKKAPPESPDGPDPGN